MQNKANKKLSESVKKLRRSKMKYNLVLKMFTEPSYEWDYKKKQK